MDCFADERIAGKFVLANRIAIGRTLFVEGVVRIVDTYFEKSDVASYLHSFYIHERLHCVLVERTSVARCALEKNLVIEGDLRGYLYYSCATKLHWKSRNNQ